MNSEQLISTEKRYLLQTYNRPDFVISRGEGVWLYDKEGNKYLDAGSGIAVNALGHGDPDVQQAIQQAGQGLLHISNLYHNEPMTLLARDLCNSCFADRIFFCNSGSEANEGAIKFARKYARQTLGREDKTGIVAFSGSFHGRSMGALAVTATEKYRLPFQPLMPGVTFASYNDIESAQASITNDTCAVILEPVQGEGGVTPASSKFLAAVRKRCNEVNALLIFDEVQCGLGRTGNLWAHQGYNITPDIMTIAKPIAGGLPMGAILMTEAVAEVMQPGDHGSTFAGGPFISQVARVVFNKINRPEFLDAVAEHGEQLKRGLQNLAQSSPIISEVRGQGMMWGLLTTVPAADVVTKARDRGLLILSAGANVVRLLPALNIKAEEIDILLDKLKATLGDL